MNNALIKRFADLISAHTGLHVREQDRESLAKKIYSRIKNIKFPSPELYYELLEAGTERGNNCFDPLQSEFEWKELTLLLTIGESYFFRDAGQFSLLRSVIFPELIKRRKDERTLKIWSAGCSTGEEPYSLAVLLQEMIPDQSGWKISIVGTDINQTNIEKAKRGFYSSWSFRMVDPQVQSQYFVRHNNEWQIKENLREMVTFRYGNLVNDEFPNSESGLEYLDLIICRNVFVYFSSEAISLVLKKFHRTLKPGGYLITAHAELHGHQLAGLKAKVFPESVIYQRQLEKVGETLNQNYSGEELQQQIEMTPVPSRPVKELYPPLGTATQTPLKYEVTPAHHSQKITPIDTPISIVNPLTPPLFKQSNVNPLYSNKNSQIDPHPTNPQILLREAQLLFEKEAYREAIQLAKRVLELQKGNFAAYYLIAQAYANLGQHEKARHFAHQALEIDSLSPEPYYLLAHLAEEQGDMEAAKNFCKRIIYLAPSSIFAYLDLASLYEREGNITRANKMRKTALELLKELPPDTRLEQQDDLKAGELVQYVKKMLKK